MDKRDRNLGSADEDRWVEDPAKSFADHTGLSIDDPVVVYVIGYVARLVAMDAAEQLHLLLADFAPLAEQLKKFRIALHDLKDSDEWSDAQHVVLRHQRVVEADAMLHWPEAMQKDWEAACQAILSPDLKQIVAPASSNWKGSSGSAGSVRPRAAASASPASFWSRSAIDSQPQRSCLRWTPERSRLLAAHIGIDAEACADVAEAERRWREVVATARGKRRTKLSKQNREMLDGNASKHSSAD
jgi:hypothetical protein